jgi:hypothetical protein
MLKFILVVLLFVSTLASVAQENIPVTSSITIEGQIKKTIILELSDIKKYTTVFLDSIRITNHLMEYRKTIKNIKGVLLKDILSKIEFEVSSSKLMSEFYIICMASDNYKVVFSWNEIFNNDLGKKTLIIVSADGFEAENRDDRIALLSPSDYATGRRYVKGLQKIIVQRVK